MQTLQIIALVGVILVAYTYLIKIVVKNFKSSDSIASNLAWGFLMLITLSFLFSSSGSSSSRIGGGGYGGGGGYYDEYDDCYDDCHHDYDCNFFDHDECDFDFDDDWGQV